MLSKKKTSLPKFLLRIEGAFVLVLSLFLYNSLNKSWIFFFVLLLAPDISMIGYLKDAKFGSLLYNIFHTYTWPIILALIGIYSNNILSIQLSLIWLAHIGMDRTLGYGLKYPTKFKDTHFNRV